MTALTGGGTLRAWRKEAWVDAAVQKDSPDFVYWPLLHFELRPDVRREGQTVETVISTLGLFIQSRNAILNSHKN